MAHPTFKESVQRFLRDHIWNHIDLAIPLHLPTHKIREAASPTLGPALFNFRRMETLFDFSNPDSVPCSCFDIWKRLQRSQRPPSPHYECVAIAAALEQFQFQHIFARGMMFSRILRNSSFYGPGILGFLPVLWHLYLSFC